MYAGKVAKPIHACPERTAKPIKIRYRKFLICLSYSWNAQCQTLIQSDYTTKRINDLNLYMKGRLFSNNDLIRTCHKL